MITRVRPEEVANVTINFAKLIHALYDELYLDAKNVLTISKMNEELDTDMNHSQVMKYLHPVFSGENSV